MNFTRKTKVDVLYTLNTAVNQLTPMMEIQRENKEVFGII